MHLPHGKACQVLRGQRGVQACRPAADDGPAAAGDVVEVRALIQQGYNNGLWNGAGISSSRGATSPNAGESGKTGLGYGEALDVGMTSFGGFSIDATAGVLEKNRSIVTETDVTWDAWYLHDGRCPTLTPLYRGADWMERECFDMFGIQFEGHPDLRRILLEDSWQGHPLLKSYAVDTAFPPYR